MSMIEVRKLVKTFGYKPVLRGIDFHVDDGEFVALVGPNGAGKTTFLRILASLSRSNMGEVRVAGYRLPAQASAVRRRLGVLSHQPLLYGDLTAEENLRFYSRMYGLRNINKRVGDILQLVGLRARRRDLVRGFSRGMQQRLAIGRAILHEPEILLFDEPHTGLDQDAAEMLDELLREVAARGRTVVMTSHDLQRAGDLATRIDILSKGKIALSLKRDEIDPSSLPTIYRTVTHA
jgi:heme exporter protein A